MKLMNLLLEAEQEQKVDLVVSQLKSEMGDLIGDIEDTLEDKSKDQKEGLATYVGIGLAIPPILGIIAKFGKFASQTISKFLGKKPDKQSDAEKYFNQMGRIADELHHLYQKPLQLALRPFIKDKEKAEKVANFIFHVIIAYMFINAGITAFKALQSKQLSLATLETAMAAVKGGEVKTYITKLLS
jgi:hypothetical protein